MALTIILLAVSFVLLLGGAFVFTNAIEWTGQRLNLGHGAVGSVLAAVATALPESIIPIVAIIGGGSNTEIAIGAIVGAPFMLGTLAMALVGISAFAFRGRREQDTKLSLDTRATPRDLIVFLIFLALTLVLGLLGLRVLNIIAAAVFVIAYGVYVWRTIASGAASGAEEEPSSLFFDPTKHDPPRNIQIIGQVIVGLGLIVGGAHLFVIEVEHLAHAFGVPALVLALLIAPLASELPEKINSFLWVREGKDALALGNITGAMVFQSMIPVAAGLAFTDWTLSSAPVAAIAASLIGGAIALFTVQRAGRFAVPLVVVWAALYVGAAVYVAIAA